MGNSDKFGPFADEAKELLQNLSDTLLAIESKGQGDQDSFSEVSRILHTLKGILRLVEYQKSAHLIHLLETIYVQISPTDIDAIKEVGKVSFSIIDSISAIVSILADTDIDIEDASIIARIEELTTKYNIETVEVKSTAGEIEFLDDDENGDDSQQDEVIENPDVLDTKDILNAAKSESVKVSVTKIDELISVSSELNINKIKFVTMGEYFNELCLDAAELVSSYNPQNAKSNISFLKLLKSHAVKCNQFKDQFAGELRTTSSLAFELQEKVSHMRLLPAREMLSTYSRSAHDLSDELGKPVDFSIEGEDVEVDKHVVDELRPSLIHLVTNAIIHGIEGSDDRRTLGKNEVGKVKFTVLKRGMMFVFICEDDGRGIPEDQLIDKAIDGGLLSSRPSYISSDLIKRLIFNQGLSSAEEVGALAGRGVGLSALQASVTKLRGDIFVEYEKNRHTRFIIEIPQGLSSVSCLEVLVRDNHFLLSTNYIHQTFILHKEDIDHIKNQAFFEYNSELIPVINTSSLLELSKSELVPDRFNLVVLEHNRMKIGFIVDSCLGFKEIIVKPMIPYLKGLKLYEGITIQGDGSPILMLSVPTLFSDVHHRVLSGETDSVKVRADDGAGKRVLLLEDTVTTRMLEKAILEHAGYTVAAFSTSREATHSMRSNVYDLLLIDILLPDESGEHLIRTIREDERYTDIPIVVVSSLPPDSPQLKSIEGLIQGQISKTKFDQRTLLSMVRSLINRSELISS